MLTKCLGQVATLRIHAFDHSVDLCVNIRLLFGGHGASVLVGLLEAGAELPEILAGLRANVVKQLYDNLLWFGHSRKLVRHVNVAAAGRLIDRLTVRILSRLTVYQNACLVRVTEVAESPLKEIVHAADVLRAVEDDQVAALMLVEQTLMLRLRFRKVLVPLRREVLLDRARDAARILLL